MKNAGIALLSAVAAWCFYLGLVRDSHYYVYAFVLGLGIFRLTTGSACPLVWLLSKLGIKGLACPSDRRGSGA